MNMKNRFELELSLEQALPYFGVVTVVAAVCLAISYDKAFVLEHAALGKKSSSSSESDSMEAAAWTVFITNAKFLGLFLTIAFGILPLSTPALLNYVISVADPAGLLVAIAN